jgi:hypothetical protein
MADQPGPTRFQTLFESALQAYQEKTEITLVEHPLAVQLRSCNSVDSIITLLLGQAQAFSDFREGGRIVKSIISILQPLSVATSVADAFDPVCQNATMAAFTSLTSFHRHSHLRKQYKPVSLSYLQYVPFCCSHVDILVTSKWIRRPMA